MKVPPEPAGSIADPTSKIYPWKQNEVCERQVGVVNWLEKLARLARLERAASCLEGSCSIHLSYRRVRAV